MTARAASAPELLLRDAQRRINPEQILAEWVEIATSLPPRNDNPRLAGRLPAKMALLNNLAALRIQFYRPDDPSVWHTSTTLFAACSSFWSIRVDGPATVTR